MSGLRYVRTIVVAHGASEVKLCESVRANLKIPMEILSENAGSKCIQINSLEDLFSEKIFKKYIARFAKSPKFEIKNKTLVNTKIFPIMDTDDCSKDI
jgi:hypothetical protein